MPELAKVVTIDHEARTVSIDGQVFDYHLASMPTTDTDLGGLAVVTIQLLAECTVVCDAG